MVEHSTENAGVTGSTPVLSTIEAQEPESRTAREQDLHGIAPAFPLSGFLAFPHSRAWYRRVIPMAEPLTEMGAGGNSFPTTQWSRLLRARDDADPGYRDGLQQILLEYWRPVYVFIRRSWGKSNEDAKDLAQEFFLEVVEKDLVARYAPQRGRFRTFLKTALKNFLSDEHRTANRQKRGGGKVVLPFDRDLLPLEEIATAPGEATPEACFDRAWANELLAAALVDLEKALAAEGRREAFETLRRYDLDAPPGPAPGYKEVAQQLGRAESAVKNDLAYARQRLRQCLVERVRLYVASESEVFAELKDILSV